MTNMVAAGISFFGTEHAISDQIDAYKHDADVSDFNAATTKQQGEASDQALDRNIRATQGSMEAAYGGSGVTMDGSPLVVMADSIRRGVLDRATNKYNFDTQARNYTNQATGYRLLAHNIKRTQFMTSLSAGLASFNGGNGGMGNVGSTGQTHDTYNLGGNTSSFSSDMNSVGGNTSSFMTDMNHAGGVSGGDYGYLGSGNNTGYYGGNSLSSGWGS
jgi:hypothetical protein